MEKSIKLGLASMMIASSVLFSCSTSTEKIEQAEENVVDSKNELKEEKEAYQKELKEYRKNAEKRISENEKKTSLNLPLLVQFKPIEYFTILAGPQFSYLFNEKNVYTFGSNSTEQEQAFNNEDPRNNILGFVIGADLNIDMLVISARAAWDFQTNNKNSVSTTPRYKNQLLQLTVGFRI